MLLRAPQAAPRLAREVAAAVEALRAMDLYKPPGVAETIDWAAAIAALGLVPSRRACDGRHPRCGLKYQEDQYRVRTVGLTGLIEAAAARAGSSPPTDRREDVGSRLAVAFATVLRGAGIEVPVSGVIEYAQALGVVGLGRRESVYWAGRATLLQRAEDAAVYDAAFSLFFDRADALARLHEVVPLAVTTDFAADDGKDGDGPPAKAT